VSKEELLKTADHVMLVVPYSAESHHTIGAAELAQMKPTATLVNIARGGIVDDAALAKALAARQIAAAGIDVFEGEPSVHPDLLKVSNVVLTPHIASSTVKTRMAMAQLAADNLVAYLTRGQGIDAVEHGDWLRCMNEWVLWALGGLNLLVLLFLLLRSGVARGAGRPNRRTSGRKNHRTDRHTSIGPDRVAAATVCCRAGAS
jgi:hypothetical protein